MYQSALSASDEQATNSQGFNGRILTLLTSEELEQGPCLPGLENILCHTPLARDARVCKAEAHRTYLCGTIVTPRHTKDRRPISFGYLLTKDQIIICDDAGVAHRMFQRIREENPQLTDHIGGLLYGFLELLIAKECTIFKSWKRSCRSWKKRYWRSSGNFNYQMTALRKELTSWSRYYTAMDMVCEFEENENEFFTDIETRQFHMVREADRAAENEAQILREYGLQIRSYFRRNRYTAEPDRKMTSSPLFFCPDLSSWLVWDELFQYAGVVVEIWLSCGNRDQLGNRDDLQLDHERKILVTSIWNDILPKDGKAARKRHPLACQILFYIIKGINGRRRIGRKKF